VSISDNSGFISSRPMQERPVSERSGESARFLSNLDPGGGSGPLSVIPGDEVTGVIDPNPPTPAPEPIPGDEITGIISNPPAPDPPLPPPARSCAVYVYYDLIQTAADERVCPECGPLDGTEHQSGFGPYPPLHDHCRCTRTPFRWECYYSDGEYGGGGRGLPWEE
jgi:hypothetical protein